jgi:hypothetical protein
MTMDLLQDSVYTARQWELDHAKNREEAWEWFRHVTVLEQARCMREPGYVPHVYQKPPGPPIRQVVEGSQP